jgi:hypothetical protein
LTVAQLALHYPEFASASQVDVDRIVVNVDCLFNSSRWGNFYEVGLASCVAHFLALFPSTGGTVDADAGDETRVSIFKAIDYERDPGMAQKQAKDPFQRTRYGQIYRFYAEMVGAGGLVV